jgi:putative phosphoesterase
LPRGERRLPDTCLRELDGADLIIHAGDFVAMSVLEELQALGPVAAVHGNMDEPALGAALPKQLVVDAAGLKLGMVHDGGPRQGRQERLVARFPDCAVVVYGHSHMPELTQRGGVWILNPGSPTERRKAPAHTMIRLEVRGDLARPELLELEA